MKNQTHQKNDLVLLIMADMCNRKLIMGLDAIGLSTDDFNTNLSSFIFEKMNISAEHETYIGNWYEDIVYTLLNIDFETFKENQFVLAITLYDALHEEIQKLQTEYIVKAPRKQSLLQYTKFSRCDN